MSSGGERRVKTCKPVEELKEGGRGAEEPEGPHVPSYPRQSCRGPAEMAVFDLTHQLTSWCIWMYRQRPPQAEAQDEQRQGARDPRCVNHFLLPLALGGREGAGVTTV